MKQLLIILATCALQFACAYVYATSINDGPDAALAGWAWLSGESVS